MEEKRSNLDGNVDEIAKELQRMEGKKQYLEEEKTDLSEALDRQRHIFESKVNEQGTLVPEAIYRGSEEYSLRPVKPIIVEVQFLYLT